MLGVLSLLISLNEFIAHFVLKFLRLKFEFIDEKQQIRLQFNRETDNFRILFQAVQQTELAKMVCLAVNELTNIRFKSDWI